MPCRPMLSQALRHLKITLQARARGEDGAQSMQPPPGMENLDTASMLAIAYHNIAVEQVHF